MSSCQHHRPRFQLAIATALLGLLASPMTGATDSHQKPTLDPMYMIVFGGKNKVASINSPTSAGQTAGNEADASEGKAAGRLQPARELSQQ